ncbi:lipase chaperone [Bacillus sp. FSL M7-0996]|uniref:lipase chaperone n=1 Tax=Bacillus sp. FSL M7-0996 TaxID=2921538 RepID=UPI000BEC9EFB|nr:hypothetical protein CON22_17570 [Bacillus cereus]
MSGAKIFNVSEIVKLNDKISEISDKYIELMGDIITNADEKTAEEKFENLKANYPMLHQEIKEQMQKLSVLNPVAELVNVHTQLTALFDKLDDDSNRMTNSLEIDYFLADLGHLFGAIKRQQYSVEEIQSITQKLVYDLTDGI